MRALVIGGSGHVGRLILPALGREHALRVLDLAPPPEGPWEYVQGDLTGRGVLGRAMAGQDALIYLAMSKTQSRAAGFVEQHYRLNVLGVQLACEAAVQASASRLIYASTLSIYAGDLQKGYVADESVAATACDPYGLTKWLGEEVCKRYAEQRGLAVRALRLCKPCSASDWARNARKDTVLWRTHVDDVSSAFLAALEADPIALPGFEAFSIHGNYEGKIASLAKARLLLGWEPLARPAARRPISARLGALARRLI